MKKIYILSTVGIVIGNFIATYFGPTFLAWWFKSPVNMAIDCSSPIEWAMKNLIIIQMVGTLLGGLAGLAICFLFLRKKEQS